MNSIERVLLEPNKKFFSAIQVIGLPGSRILVAANGTGSMEPQRGDIVFEGHKLGEVIGSGDESFFQEFARIIAPIMNLAADEKLFARNLRILDWLEAIRQIAPDICHWTGIYWKENFLKETDSTDLLLGPFLGDSTDHLRIPLNRGFCGLALSEERVVNVADVRADTRHIACSLKTRSELVIPLANREGAFIAELDIDSNQLAAFSSDLEAKLRLTANAFKDLI